MFGNASEARPVGREHIPLLPSGFIGIRIAQLVVAVIILGLDAYGLSQFAFSSNSLNMFTCLATIIATVYLLVAEFAAPKLYNYWAVLALDVFLVIFWLISFAYLASDIPALKSVYCGWYYCSGFSDTFSNSMAAVAGLGGLEFILFVVALIIHSLALHKHRLAGLHSKPFSEKTAVSAPVPLPNYGATPVAIVQPIQQEPVQQYQQQQPVQPVQQYQQPVQPVQPVQPQYTGGYPEQQQQQQIPQQVPQQIPQVQVAAPQEVPGQTQYVPTPPPQQAYVPPQQQQ